MHLGHYIHFNWTTFKANLDGFRKWGWSRRLLEWLTLAGLIGLARRSIPGAVLLGGWFAGYLFLKGGDPTISIVTGKFLIEMIPALPAFLVLGMSVVHLIPIYGRRPLRADATTSWPQSQRSKRRLLALLALLAAVPIALFALLPPLTAPRAAQLGSYDVYIPTDQFPFALLPLLTAPRAAQLGSYDVYIPTDQFPLTATATAGSVTLSWPHQHTRGTQAYYIIFRARTGSLDCVTEPHAADECRYRGGPVGILPATTTSYHDHPQAGRWIYRVALAASAVGPATNAYPLTLSMPAPVTPRP